MYWAEVTILFYFAWALDAMGGAELSVRALAEALVKRGHDVGIVETASPLSTQGRVHPFGGRVWTVPAVYAEHRRPGPMVLSSLGHFRDILSQFKPDVVSVQCPAWQSVPVVFACAPPRRWRLEVTVRGSDIREDLILQPKLRPWVRRLCGRADAATAVSRSLWRQFVREFPIVRKKGGVIYDGVGREWFKHAGEAPRGDHAPVVLYVGRLHREKGVDLLMRAWKLLRPPMPETALWLAGEGEAADDLRALAHRLGISGRLRFLGRVSQADLPSLYRSATLVVIPSISEGLPRVALEAGACGAVCVATRVGGIPEVIDNGVTGFLARPRSPRALADALEHALRLRPKEGQRMGAAAAGRIRCHFDHDQTVAGYEVLFRSLLDAP